MPIFEVQLIVRRGHKDEGAIVDVRELVDGIPRGQFGEKKPWGSGDKDPKTFRIERQSLSQLNGEKLREASLAHEHDRQDVGLINDDDALLDYILHKTDDNFRSRLRGEL